jgi:hypothetical protein
MDPACTKPRATTLTMDQRDDARAEELNNLRLALATFALQLDAFEMRTNQGPLRAGTKPGTLRRRVILVAGFRRKR